MAGFSQGGAIALQTALRYPERLAGVLALSTYLPRAGSLQSERSPANQGHSDLHGARQLRRHHSAAPRRKIAQAARGRRLLRRVARVPDAAFVCAEEIADMAAFLARIV